MNTTFRENCSGLARPLEDLDLLSDDTAAVIEFALGCVAFPVLTAFGLVGNIVSAIVLLQRQLFGPTAVLLLGLTSADGLFLVTNILQYSTCINKRISPENSNEYFVKSFTAIFYMRLGFSRVSTVLVSAISLERFIAVAFPLKVKNIVTKRRMVAVVMTTYIVTFGCLVLVPLQTTSETIDGKDYLVMTDFYKENQTFFDLYYMQGIVILFRWIPKVLVIVSNSLIIVYLRGRLNPSAVGRRSARSTTRSVQTQEQQRITRMLLVVAMLFIICLLPGDVFLIVGDVVDGFDLYGRYRRAFLTFSSVSILFEMVNSSINFVVYMALNKTFSAVYREILCKCRQLDTRTNSVSETDRPAPVYAISERRNERELSK